MAHDVFVSYSSKDKPAADAACAVLESAGIRCWIAPRDILPGSDWGESIIGAVNGCKLMVLIFSSNANESQQIKREVERVVNRGLPIIPVRIEEVLPAQALEYFLSTPHWMDAFTPPLERHLQQLAAIVKEILGQAPRQPKANFQPARKSPWWRYAKPLGTAAAIITALILLAIIALHNMGGGPAPIAQAPPKADNTVPQPEALPAVLPTPAANTASTAVATAEKAVPAVPAAAAGSPLAGRWQAEIKGDDGKNFKCLMDLQSPAIGPMGPANFLSAAFSDFCPLPFCGYRGNLQIAQDGTWAPSLFRAGKDTGTFDFLGGSLHNVPGVFRLEGDNNTLVMTSSQLPTIRWQRIKADGPLPSVADVVLPKKIEWPVKDLPGIAQRAQDYVRVYWQKDSKLVNIDVKHPPSLSAAAPPQVDIVFEFISPETGHGLHFEPGAQYGNSMMDVGPATWGDRAIPANFLDLPDAIAALSGRGIKAQQVTEATLDYDESTNNRDTIRNNAILPSSPDKKSGFYWMIDSDGHDRVWVYAEKP